MSTPEATDCLPCGCLPGADVCPRCTPVGEASVPTATMLRRTPGSVADLTAQLAVMRREVLATHDALNAAGAPMGGSPAERIAALADDRDIDRRDGNEYLAALHDLRRNLTRILGVDKDMDGADICTLVEHMANEVRARVGEMEARKPSPSLPHVLALLDLAAEKNAALTHLVAILRGAL